MSAMSEVWGKLIISSLCNTGLLYRLIEYIPVGVVITDPQGCCVAVNTVARGILGSDCENIMQVRLQYIDGRQNQQQDHPVLEAVKNCSMGKSVEVLVSQQEERFFLLTSNPVWNSAGRVRAVVLIFCDITDRIATEKRLNAQRERLELLVSQRLYDLTMTNAALLNEISDRKQAEESLRKSEERFYKAFHVSPIPMTIRYFNSQYIDVNKAFERFSGYSRDEIIGHAPWELNLGEDVGRMKRIALLQQCGAFYNQATEYRVRSGEIRSVLLSAEILELATEKCFLSIIYDITDYKRMEKEMARLGMLNVVGQMAAAIGHEIRNPMTTVRGYLQWFSRKPEFAGYGEQFDLMIDELDRANHIITEFLSLARNKTVVKKSQDLNNVIASVSSLITADAAELGREVATDLGTVKELVLNDKEIRQVILNLIRNAVEASPPGGKVTVKTYMEGDIAVLAVKDQGTGMTQEVLDKLGTPFFSTKENGTGLGLAVCYSIAARHNAAIAVETGPTGTTVFVKFKPQQ